MHFNWVDWIIIAVILYEAYDGWEAGIVSLAVRFISFAVSLWLAIVFHEQVAHFLTDKFGIVSTWSTITAYVVVGFISQMAVMQLLFRFVSLLPKKIADSKINSWLGAIVSVINGLIVAAFVLVIILALPLRGTIRKDIRQSQLGGAITNLTQRYGGPLNVAVDEVQKQAQTFFTILPQSKESVPLDVAPKPSDLQADDQDENNMLVLVNAERVKTGAPALVVDEKITAVARLHSRDMFVRRYFSHYTPEGKDPANRMIAGGVTFNLMGENLAYAPDVAFAHQGLMNSPEHKKNILDPQFHRVGIGIISTDSYGIMVTQDFAN